MDSDYVIFTSFQFPFLITKSLSDRSTHDLHWKLEPKWYHQRFWNHVFANFGHKHHNGRGSLVNFGISNENLTHCMYRQKELKGRLVCSRRRALGPWVGVHGLVLKVVYLLLGWYWCRGSGLEAVTWWLHSVSTAVNSRHPLVIAFVCNFVVSYQSIILHSLLTLRLLGAACTFSTWLLFTTRSMTICLGAFLFLDNYSDGTSRVYCFSWGDVSNV